MFVHTHDRLFHDVSLVEFDGLADNHSFLVIVEESDKELSVLD